MSKNHPGIGKKFDALAIASECPLSSTDSATCPLCQEVFVSRKTYIAHVGRHQQDIAIFALPNLPPEFEDDKRDIESAEEEVDSSVDSAHLERSSLKSLSSSDEPIKNEQSSVTAKPQVQFHQQPPEQLSASTDDKDLPSDKVTSPSSSETKMWDAGSFADRRRSFATDVWAARPSAEGIVDNLEDFFPNINLDQPVIPEVTVHDASQLRQSSNSNPDNMPLSVGPDPAVDRREQSPYSFAPSSAADISALEDSVPADHAAKRKEAAGAGTGRAEHTLGYTSIRLSAGSVDDPESRRALGEAVLLRERMRLAAVAREPDEQEGAKTDEDEGEAFDGDSKPRRRSTYQGRGAPSGSTTVELADRERALQKFGHEYREQLRREERERLRREDEQRLLRLQEDRENEQRLLRQVEERDRRFEANAAAAATASAAAARAAAAAARAAAADARAATAAAGDERERRERDLYEQERRNQAVHARVRRDARRPFASTRSASVYLPNATVRRRRRPRRRSTTSFAGSCVARAIRITRSTPLSTRSSSRRRLQLEWMRRPLGSLLQAPATPPRIPPSHGGSSLPRQKEIPVAAVLTEALSTPSSSKISALMSTSLSSWPCFRTGSGRPSRPKS